MANENVKIIVQEFNETTPKGSGTSSDIAYVPGLSAKADAVKNTPILCSTIDEFEAAFGTAPYVFTEADVADYDGIYHAGEYDKSYIYAKELINAGLSVLYEFVADPTTPGFDSAGITVASLSSDQAESYSVTSNGNNVYTVKALKASGSPIKITHTLALPSVQLTSGEKINVIVDPITKDDQGQGAAIEKLNVSMSGGYKPTDYFESISPEVLLTDVSSTSLVVKEGKSIDATIASALTITVTVQVPYPQEFGSYSYAFGAGINVDLDNASLYNNSLIKDLLLGDGDANTYGLAVSLDKLRDKNEYQVKYITSGAYPTFTVGSDNNGLADLMIDVAYDRNDAVAIIDHDFDRTRPHVNEDSLQEAVNSYFGSETKATFGTMFTPYGPYSCTTVPDVNKMTQIMPASFGYLLCVARTIKTSPNWLAMAGVTRGLVPNLKGLECDKVLSNDIAENYQPKYGTATNKVSINAITNIKPYGLCIWGNRTLLSVDPLGTTALNFLNTRNMISDIKKVAYSTAKKLMFEQDSDALWLRFKSGVSPLLDQLVSGYGISDYKIIRNNTKYNGKALTRGEMAAVIKIFPRYAIEYFEITVVIADEDVSVS